MQRQLKVGKSVCMYDHIHTVHTLEQQNFTSSIRASRNSVRVLRGPPGLNWPAEAIKLFLFLAALLLEDSPPAAGFEPGTLVMRLPLYQDLNFLSSAMSSSTIGFFPAATCIYVCMYVGMYVCMCGCLEVTIV